MARRPRPDQTHREIGRRLCSTVEQHLTRVYRKLNVRKRTELPAELSYLHDDTDDRTPTPVRGFASVRGDEQR